MPLDRECFLPGPGVPNLHLLAVPGGGEVLAIRAERDARSPVASPLKRSSSFLGEIGGVAKKSGLPMFWQIAQSVRCF